MSDTEPKKPWVRKWNTMQVAPGFQDEHNALVEAYLVLEQLINAPEIRNFIEGAVREAGHQVQRWDAGHDAQKSPEDWLWVVAFLSTKAVQAERYGDREKYLHHIVTTAAACANWHRLAMATISGTAANG